MSFLIKGASLCKFFFFLVLLLFIHSVNAQTVNVTNPLADVNITTTDNFNINWTSSGNNHHKVAYTTNTSAACTGSSGSTGEVSGWTLICHDTSCSSPKSVLLGLNSSNVRVKVTGHDGPSHNAISVNCSDTFTIASISSAPTNLISSVVNLTATNLSWDTQLSTDLVSKYLIFRDSVNIANTTDNNTNFYLDTGLNSSLYYNYTVKTQNPIGDSIFSNALNVSTSSNDTTAPATIGNLTAAEIGDNHIFWNWTNPADADFNHTQIYRNGVFIENVYFNASVNNSYNMTGLVTNTPYSISIRTVDNSSNVNTTFINSTQTTTGSSGGDTGGGSGGSGESVSLSSPNGGESWEPSSSHDITWTSSGIDHFEIYYSTNSGSSWILLKAHPYGSSGTTSYSWTVPSSTSSTMRVRVDGHDENHTVQANDASNSDFSIATSSTSPSSTGSSSGGGTTKIPAIVPTTWEKTYNEDEKEFSEKVFVEKVLKKKERVKLKIDGENHSVGVVNITNTTALIEVASTLQQATLTIGENKSFEVTNDSFYDILVQLNNITNETANITISYIHVPVPQDSLFNIILALANSLIKDISELVAIVTFRNFGNISWLVELTFVILDEAKNEVYKEKSNISVLTEETLEKKFENIDLPSGKYTLVVSTLYNVSIIAELRQDFEIDKGIFKTVGWMKFLIYVLIIFIGVFISVSVWYFVNKFRKGKKDFQSLTTEESKYMKKKNPRMNKTNTQNTKQR